MTEQPLQPQRQRKRRAAEKPLESIDVTLEALVQQRTAALQQENERLRAEIQAHKAVEATLHQQAEQFRSLVNHIPGAVYRAAFDNDWTIAFISDAIAQLSGYPAADFIQNQAQSFNTICHPDDLARVNHEIRTAIAAKQPFVVEYRNIRADGQVVWVCEQGHGVYGANGEGVWLDGVVLDITPLKQIEAALRQSEGRLKLITDAVPVCIAYIDRNQCFQFANKTYETWFGVPATDIQGKHLSAILGKASYQLIREKVERALTGEMTTYALELPYQWGGNRYISAVLIPDIDAQQQVQGYYALVMDISAQQPCMNADRQKRLSSSRQSAIGSSTRSPNAFANLSI